MGSNRGHGSRGVIKRGSTAALFGIPTIMSNNPLIPFLYDHPWTSERLLEAIFGAVFKQMSLPSKTRTVTVPGVGTCCGVKREKLSSVPGVRRRERAKRFLLEKYGDEIAWRGGSPGGWRSDALALVGQQHKYWIRIWVDSGAVAVEALPFLHPPPARFAPNMVDMVITTDMERAELIKRQILSHWKRGKRNVLIHHQDEGRYLRIDKYQQPPRGRLLSSKEVSGQIAKQRRKRLENVRHEQVIGRVFTELHKVDFELLKYVGDNPHFSVGDLAILLSRSVTGGNDPNLTPQLVKEKAEKRFSVLQKKGLIKRANAPLLGLKVSALGLEMLAKYWGINQESMRRFHPWPQKRKGGEVIYSGRALNHISQHTRGVQQFVFGLLDNAWRLAQPYGGVDVYLETIIGRRIYFKDLSSGEYDFVIPDAVINLSFWRRMWRDGKVHEDKNYFSYAQLFLEIDRATNPITRLEERIQKYGKIWRGLSGNPAQVWVIDGSPWREKEILEMLEAAGVNGWTVLVERLRLDKDDPWWERFSHKPGALPYIKHGGVAPLRKIWRNTADYKMHHLLGHAPWKRVMSQTKPITDVPRGY